MGKYKARNLDRALAAWESRNRPRPSAVNMTPPSTIVVPTKISVTDRRKMLKGLPQVRYGTDSAGIGWAIERDTKTARKAKGTEKVTPVKRHKIGNAPYIPPQVTTIGVRMDWLADE